MDGTGTHHLLPASVKKPVQAPSFALTNWSAWHADITTRQNWLEWAQQPYLPLGTAPPQRDTHLAAPAILFDLSAERYTRKTIRSMGCVALMACRAIGLAVQQAGLTADPVLTNSRTGIAYGSSVGSPDAQCDFFQLLVDKSTNGVNGAISK